MKKTRLLEIVREEIALALREETIDVQGDPSKLNAKQKEAAIKQARTASKDMSLGTVKNPVEFVEEDQLEEEQSSKYKQLAEKYQLDEDTINEMASIVQLKTQLEKQGKTGELEAVKAAEKATIDKLKQNPVFSGDGKNTRLKGYVSAFKKELKAEHNIDLQKLLTTVMIDAEAAGDEFKDDIATNTIEKNAAAQVLGTEKSTPGPKPNPNKPKKAPSTGKKGSPAGAAKEKVATRTPGADGFDDVSYSDVDSEDKEATQNIDNDEIAQSLSNVTGVADKFAALFKANTAEEAKKKMQALAKKANAGDQKAKAFFNNKKYSKIIKDYMNKKQVNI